MRSFKFLVCIAVFYMVAFTARGQTSDKIAIADVGSGIFKLVYKSNDSGPLKVSIMNSKGETIFTETLKTSAFMRPYNFNDQGPGEFKFVVEDKGGKTEKTILYSIKKVESKIDVSKIANAQNKYLLSIENNDSDQILVRILDSQKDVIHEESLTVNGKSAIVFNLNKIKDSPTFEVAGSDGVWKTFTF